MSVITRGKLVDETNKRKYKSMLDDESCNCTGDCTKTFTGSHNFEPFDTNYQLELSEIKDLLKKILKKLEK